MGLISRVSSRTYRARRRQQHSFSEDEKNKLAFITYAQRLESRQNQFEECVQPLQQRPAKSSRGYQPKIFKKKLDLSSRDELPHVYSDINWRKNLINILLWPEIGADDDKPVFNKKFIQSLVANGNIYRACMICILVGDQGSCDRILKLAADEEASAEESVFDTYDVSIIISLHNQTIWPTIKAKIEAKIRKYKHLAASWYLQVIISFLDNPTSDLFPLHSAERPSDCSADNMGDKTEEPCHFISLQVAPLRKVRANPMKQVK